MSTAVLEVKDLRIKISSPGRTSTPVDGVRFDVRSGEIVSLVGESGCGKTTMAMAVAGLLPDGGEVVDGDIVIGGRSLRAMSSDEARKARTDQIGVVFQSPSTALNPRLEIGTQLREALPADLRRSAARARRACVELLGMTGLPRPADRLADYPHELSVGLAQRVVIAMALARQPLLLVADEPTSALDVGIQAQVLDLITRLQQQLNLSVLLITHDIGIVAERADRVAVMYGGQIMEQGVTSDVLGAPVHPYTAALLQALPTLTDVHAARLPTIDGVPPDLRFPVLGCPFAPRCAHASEECESTRPDVEVSADGRLFGCFHPLPAATAPPDADAAGPEAGAGRRHRGASAGTEPPAAAETIVEVRDVSREFVVRTGLRSRQVRSAVAGVSLELRAGETLGIVGESGCGKSTLGRMLVGLDFPTSGAIYYKGHPIVPGARRQRAWRGDIQLIYQNAFTSLDPRMTAEEIVAEPLRYRHSRTADRQRRVRGLVEEVGLPQSVLRRRPGQLSGGERQRIGIARALALDPSVIVADEVVSALDASAQAKVLNLFKSLQESRGLSYIFISHDLRVVSFLCDRVAVIYLGKLVECGETRQLINSPAHPYTAALLSSVPGSPAAAQLSGELPSVENPPSGCRYHTRCALATSRCSEEAPALAEIGRDHAVACHFPLQEVTGGD